MASGLKLTDKVLADIFLGNVKNWNDSEIKSLNPGVKLPSNPIQTVYRSDGSGTTYIFTNYLSTVSPAWSSGPGTGKSVSWPVGVGQKGNEGVAGFIKTTPYTIGYVELAYAVQNSFTYAKIQQCRRDVRLPLAVLGGRRRRPEARHHVGGLLHRGPARGRQLPDLGLQLGARSTSSRRVPRRGRPWWTCSTG